MELCGYRFRTSLAVLTPLTSQLEADIVPPLFRGSSADDRKNLVLVGRVKTNHGRRSSGGASLVVGLTYVELSKKLEVEEMRVASGSQ